MTRATTLKRTPRLRGGCPHTDTYGGGWAPADAPWLGYTTNGVITCRSNTVAQTLPLEFIPNPADTVLTADFDANYRACAHDSPYFIAAGSYGYCYPLNWEAFGMTSPHNGGANYGFADGHAGWVFHGTLREANFGLGPSTGSVWCCYPAL